MKNSLVIKQPKLVHKFDDHRFDCLSLIETTGRVVRSKKSKDLAIVQKDTVKRVEKALNQQTVFMESTGQKMFKTLPDGIPPP